MLLIYPKRPDFLFTNSEGMCKEPLDDRFGSNQITDLHISSDVDNLAILDCHRFHPGLFRIDGVYLAVQHNRIGNGKIALPNGGFRAIGTKTNGK